MAIDRERLIRRYNVSAPRYTSYPTVPYWDKQVPDEAQWWQAVRQTFDETNAHQGISLYLHLPFCESLCTYCACHTRITRNHAVELPYAEAILSEWDMYRCQWTNPPRLRELHLGGGTPTFYRPQNLQWMLEQLLKGVCLHPDHEFSFEGHPNNTTAAHLQILYGLGFKRVSYGIQDFDARVQRAIHRPQPYENVRRATEEARQVGYSSVNFDLVYGLPFQTRESMRATLEKVIQLRPDRIAFYSYAHVPWMRPGQRRFTEAGYADVGMDHFALPGDDLFEATRQGTLHRNFMGYTTCQTDLLVGLGASAISDAKGAYLQNLKSVEAYTESLLEGKLPVLKGHFLTKEDQLIRQALLDLICRGRLNWNTPLLDTLDPQTTQDWRQMEREGLLEMDAGGLQVTPLGQAFIRNIAMVLDQKLREPTRVQAVPQFSKAI